MKLPISILNENLVRDMGICSIYLKEKELDYMEEQFVRNYPIKKDKKTQNAFKTYFKAYRATFY